MNERDRLSVELIARLDAHRAELAAMATHMTSHWGYEDAFYRFYHQSFKVYFVQETTLAAVKLLESLLPGRPLYLFDLR